MSTQATDCCEYNDDCVTDWTHVMEVQLPSGPETFRVCQSCATTHGGRAYARLLHRRF